MHEILSMIYFKLLILGIIEVLTEFIPVSSTGHMIIASKILNIKNLNTFLNLFIISIQLGPILAILVIYYKYFISFNQEFYKKLFIAFIPSIIFGLFFLDKINFFLQNYYIVAILIFIGGFILIKIDKYRKQIKTKTQITYLNAFIIGLFQCIAFIPGISRSASVLVGSILQKIDLKTANEFSLFLAIPTILSAVIKKLFDYYLKDYLIFIYNHNTSLKYHDIIYIIYKKLIFIDLKILFISNILSFIFSLLIIKYIINFINIYGLKIFGYYRLIIGIIILFFIYY